MEGPAAFGKVRTQARARPVYRHYLAGGLEALRLPYRGWAITLACGFSASLLGSRWAAIAPNSNSFWAWTIGNCFTAAVLAQIAARWLGARTAILAGILYASSVHVLMPERLDCAASLATLAACVAMGAFAAAEVPGRIPAADRSITFGLFWAATTAGVFAAGLIGAVGILAVCLMYLAMFQDGSGLRFFTAGFRCVVLAISLAAAHWTATFLSTPSSQYVWDAPSLTPPIPNEDPAGAAAVMLWTSGRLLPWTPWILVAIGIGLRKGHYAAPLARLVFAWLAAPWILSAAGVMPARLAFALFVPAATLMAAIGLAESIAWSRRVLRTAVSMLRARQAIPSPRAESRRA
jgi:hypothetical protein